MRLGKYHPALVQYRLMKEFGWSPDQLAELDAKLGGQIIQIIRTVDSIEEDRHRQQTR